MLKRQLRALIPQKSSWNFRKSFLDSVWPSFEVIFNDNALNDEAKINKIEALIISYIQQLKNEKNQGSAKKTKGSSSHNKAKHTDDSDKILNLMLMMILFQRGYYVDNLYQLVNKLILLPFEKEKSQKNSVEWIEKVGAQYIVDFHLCIFSVLEFSSSAHNGRITKTFYSNPDRLWILIDKIRTMNKTANQNEASFLLSCMKIITDYRVFSSTIEHSVWASAAMEAYETYVTHLSKAIIDDKESTLKLATITSKAKIGELCDHLIRCLCYANKSIMLDEPLGYYVKSKVDSIIQAIDTFNLGLSRELKQESRQSSRIASKQKSVDEKKSALMHINTELGNLLKTVVAYKTLPTEQLDQQLTTLLIESKSARHDLSFQNITLFNQAFDLLIRHYDQGYDVKQIMKIATELKKGQCPLGEFFETFLFCLGSNLTEQLWAGAFLELRSCVIEKHFCENVGELWLRLANHFLMSWDQVCPVKKGQIVDCLNEANSKFIWGDDFTITNKYGLQVCKKALILLNCIKHKTKPLTQQLEGQLLLKEGCKPVESDITYLKQHQYNYVSMLLMPATSYGSVVHLANQYQILISDGYPYPFPILISNLLLNKSTAEYQAANIALLNFDTPKRCRFKKFAGNDVKEHINALKICDALKQIPDNRRLLLWSDLIRGALTNGLMFDEIQSWRSNDFDDLHITNKLLNIARSEVYSAIYIDGQVLPNGQHYLMELDNELFTISVKLIMTIKTHLKRSSTEESAYAEENVLKFWSFTKNRPGLLEACFAEMAGREKNTSLMKRLAMLAIQEANDFIIKLPVDDSSLREKKYFPQSPRTSYSKKNSPRDKIRQPQEISPRASMDINSLVLSPRSSLILSSPVSAAPRPSSMGEISPRLSRSPIGSIRERSSSAIQVLKPKRTSSPSMPKSNDAMKIIQHSEEPISKSWTSLPNTTKADRQVPTYLPYFLLALEIWKERLENNPNRSDKDIQQFREYLQASLPVNEYQDPNEADYIQACIYYEYFSLNERDPIWLADRDIDEIGVNSRRFQVQKQTNSRRYEHVSEKMIGDENALYDCFLCFEIRSLLESAMYEKEHDEKKRVDNDQRMFPLAARLYASELAAQEFGYLSYDPVHEKAFVNGMFKKCFTAVVKYGFIPPLQPLAVQLVKYVDMLEGTRLENYKMIGAYLGKSERYDFLLDSQKRDFADGVAREQAIYDGHCAIESTTDVKLSEYYHAPCTLLDRVMSYIEDNFELARFKKVNRRYNAACSRVAFFRLSQYPEFTPKSEFLIEPLLGMSCQFHYENLLFNLEFSPDKGGTGSTFLFIISHQEKNGFVKVEYDAKNINTSRVGLVLANMARCFTNTECRYLYTNKVQFVSSTINLDVDQPCLTVSHLEVALLGLAKLIRNISLLQNTIEINFELQNVKNFIDSIYQKCQHYLSGANTKEIMDQFFADYEKYKEQVSKQIIKSRNGSRLASSRRASVAIPDSSSEVVSKSPSKNMLKLVDPSFIPSSPAPSPPGSPKGGRKSRSITQSDSQDLDQDLLRIKLGGFN